MKKIPFIFCILLGFCFGCANTKTNIPIIISPKADSVEQLAAKELSNYLGKIYPEYMFNVTSSGGSSQKLIKLGTTQTLSSSVINLQKEGAFSIRYRSENNREIASIIGKGPRGALNGVYALLEKLGYGFYLSYETKPKPHSTMNFDKWEMHDTPLAKDRIVFNWHNFLSGSSSWDFSEWKAWINHSSKMRFNTIMVHAYGNNPMFTYYFKGKQKKITRLPATQGGRDYGTDQVNDIRRLHGGDIFTRSVFGAEVSQVGMEHHVKAVRKLMGRVFDYAEEQGMKISFAFDIDDTPSNPQELIHTLPSSARFCVPIVRNKYLGRYSDTFCMANPETPEGYAFYKSQIASLLELYPQIDQVALWMRRAGSEWLSLRLDQLPSDWQVEYKKIRKQHPKVSRWKEGPGRFAMGKVIAAFQRALKDIGQDNINLKVGSWTFDWMVPSDLFFPKEIGFIGLDYNVIHGTSDIKRPEKQKEMAEISQNRPITPIFWAQHDDGAYIGRPYVPIRNLQEKLHRIGASGFGIIHWMTWPLDSYFKNMVLQVWENSLNQPYKITIEKMARNLFGRDQKEKTSSYLYEWATSAPVMGRETREWFIDKAFTDQKVQAVEKGYKHRLKLLNTINKKKLSKRGKNYLQYFKGLEAFSMRFYRTENAYQQSLKYKAEGKIKKAVNAIQLCNPEQLIAQYGQFSAKKGITKGEKGIIIALNLEWLPYIETQRQALGQAPIRYNFAPTAHPKFGRGLLRTNFFMDKEQNLWRNYGKGETGANTYNLSHKVHLDLADSIPDIYKEICYSGIESDTTIIFNVQPIMADIEPLGATKDWFSPEIRTGGYQLRLLFAPTSKEETEGSIQNLFVYNRRNQPAVIKERIDRTQHTKGKNNILLKAYDISVPHQGRVTIKLEPVKGKANICGAILHFK